MYAEMTRETWKLKEGRKAAYRLEATRTEEIDQMFYRNFIDAAPCFRRAGSKETLQRSYTHVGYLVTKVISVSPDREIKKITTFKFWHPIKKEYE